MAVSIEQLTKIIEDTSKKSTVVDDVFQLIQSDRNTWITTLSKNNNAFDALIKMDPEDLAVLLLKLIMDHDNSSLYDGREDFTRLLYKSDIVLRHDAYRRVCEEWIKKIGVMEFRGDRLSAISKSSCSRNYHPFHSIIIQKLYQFANLNSLHRIHDGNSSDYSRITEYIYYLVHYYETAALKRYLFEVYTSNPEGYVQATANILRAYSYFLSEKLCNEQMAVINSNQTQKERLLSDAKKNTQHANEIKHTVLKTATIIANQATVENGASVLGDLYNALCSDHVTGIELYEVIRGKRDILIELAESCNSSAQYQAIEPMLSRFHHTFTCFEPEKQSVLSAELDWFTNRLGRAITEMEQRCKPRVQTGATEHRLNLSGRYQRATRSFLPADAHRPEQRSKQNKH